MRRVLVLAQFAVPPGAAGGTRHVELFARLRGWRGRILAADWAYGAGRRKVRVAEGQVEFRTVRVTGYRGNNLGRVVNWLTFLVSAATRGVVGPQPDVVYASSPPLTVGLAGWLVSRLRRVPLIFEVRDLWPRVFVEMGALRDGSVVHRVLVGVERFLYRRADAVVILARGSRAHVEAAGVPADRIHFIPNGADLNAFAERQPTTPHREGFVVAYTGAHGPANGLDFVLDAAAELADELPDVEFLLVGSGVEKPRLVDRVEHDGIGNVRFRDPVPKAEMGALLASVDVGLHVLADIEMFRFGVSPNKLFDYMAAGLPVITNTPGEVAELVAEAGAGIAVEPDGIAAAVRTIYRAEPEQRERWGSSGRDFIAGHRSREVLADELERVLNATVNSA